MLALSTIPCGWHAYSQVLLSNEPNFACSNLESKLNFNYTFDEYFALSVPFESKEGTAQRRSCQTFDYGGLTFNSFDDAQAFYNRKYQSCSAESGCSNDVFQNLTVDCVPQEFNYNDTDGTYTATTRWDTVCDRSFMQDFDTQTFMIGKLLGAFVFGAMSDSIGRFKTYFISLVLQAVFGIMVAVSPNFWLYSISRLLVGAACSGVYLCAYILALEFIGQVISVSN